MREADREILEEAVRNSAGSEDFDEMLLRATKKHLPRKYHRHFSLMLEEILTKADELGVSNRSAAQSFLKRPAQTEKKAEPPEDALARILGQPPAAPEKGTGAPKPAPPARAAEHASVPAAADEPPTEATGESARADGTEEPAIEKLPEEQKILDLGGTDPDSLSPEIRDKLRKLVKAQKRRQALEEGASEGEPEPGLFFKGRQRAPPFVPLSKPAKKDDGKDEPAATPPSGEEEEDLEKG